VVRKFDDDGGDALVALPVTDVGGYVVSGAAGVKDCLVVA
jgi:hypothetical protein